MTKVRLVMLGMLAVFAVSAVASVSASASTVAFWECKKVESGGHWKDSQCTEKESGGKFDTREITKETFEATSETSELASTILGERIIISCGKDTSGGALTAGGGSEGRVEFSKCFITGKNGPLNACKVKEPIKFAFTDQLRVNGGKIEDEFKGVLAEEVFVEITITGIGCAIAKTEKVKGTQICELPNGQQPLITHQVVCSPTGSKLTLGGETAEFTSNEHIKLSSGLDWGSS